MTVYCNMLLTYKLHIYDTSCIKLLRSCTIHVLKVATIAKMHNAKNWGFQLVYNIL